MSDPKLAEYRCARCGALCPGICVLGRSVVCTACFLGALPTNPETGNE